MQSLQTAMAARTPTKSKAAGSIREVIEILEQ